MVSELDSGSYWTLDRLRDHWVFVVLALLIPTVLGGLLGLAKPPVYTAEARLAVGSGSMSDLNIPGFPTASIAMASNYARWVQSNGVPGSKGLPSGTKEVRASPFPESNVIRLEAVADAPTTAVKAVNVLSRDLRNDVNGVTDANDTAALAGKVADQSKSVASAQLKLDDDTAALRRARSGGSTADVESARKDFLRDNAEFTRAQLLMNGLQDRYRRLVSTGSTEASLNMVGDGGQLTKNSRSSTAQRYALLGFALGVVIALVGIRLRDPLPRRRV